jgi:hypothetical protein
MAEEASETTRPAFEGRDILGGPESGPWSGKPVSARQSFESDLQPVARDRGDHSQPQRSGFPLTLALPDDQLPRPSWIKISQIRTISAERLGKRLGAADKDVLDRTIDGLLELIG